MSSPELDNEPAQNGASPTSAEPTSVANPDNATEAANDVKADSASPETAKLDGIDDEDREAIEKLLEGKKEPGGANLLTAEEEKLTTAEKAHLLQKRLRERRLEKEKQEAMFAEKHRIESMKMMAETRRQLEEAEKKRAFEFHLREKEEKRLAEEKQKELLRADFRERFGRDMNEEELLRQQVSKMSNREKVVFFVGKLGRRMKETSDEAEKAKVLLCAKTVRVYCVNLKDHPGELKYYTIKMTNKAFQERVAPYPEAVEILKCVGFHQKGTPDDGPVLQVQTALPDGFTLGEGIKFLNFITGQQS